MGGIRRIEQANLKSLGSTDIMSGSEENTPPTVSPNQGATSGKASSPQEETEKVIAKSEKLAPRMKWNEMSSDQKRELLIDTYDKFGKYVYQKTMASWKPRCSVLDEDGHPVPPNDQKFEGSDIHKNESESAEKNVKHHQ